MRIGLAGCFHESNTFAPGTTDLAAFRKEWALDREAFDHLYKHTSTSVGGVIDSAEQHGFELVPIFFARAAPSGTVATEAMNKITSVLLQQLDNAVHSLDGLVLVLHGAMVSENIEDVEGMIMREARRRMGVKPIAATLDLHANVSDEMAKYADVLTGFDTYPHIDMYERAQEACRLLLSVIRGQIKPVHHTERPNLLISPSAMDTNQGPFRTLMEKVFEYEKDPEVLNIVAAGGFPFADVRCAGVSITVTTNDNLTKAKQIAKDLSTWFRKHREAFRTRSVSIEQALRQIEQRNVFPAVLIESFFLY